MGFKLRSGNGPLNFKMMGSRTPLEYNSPIHEEEESEEENGGNDENGDDNGDNDDKGGGRTKKNRFMDALTRGVTYGLSEVYGIDKEKWDKDIKTKKKEKKKKNEDLDEMSAMSTGAVATSPKKEPLEEEDGFYEPHI